MLWTVPCSAAAGGEGAEGDQPCRASLSRRGGVAAASDQSSIRRILHHRVRHEGPIQTRNLIQREGTAWSRSLESSRGRTAINLGRPGGVSRKAKLGSPPSGN